MKYSEYSNSSVQRQTVEWWLPGAEEEREMQSHYLTGTKFQTEIMKKALETDGWRWLRNIVSVPETRWVSEKCTGKNGRFYDMCIFTGLPC